VVGHVLYEDAAGRVRFDRMCYAVGYGGVAAVGMAGSLAALGTLAKGWGDLLGAEVKGIAEWFVDTDDGVGTGHEDLGVRS